MCTLERSIKRFFSDESGVEAVEFGVITALILATLIATLGLLAAAVEGRFTSARSTLDGIDT